LLSRQAPDDASHLGCAWGSQLLDPRGWKRQQVVHQDWHLRRRAAERAGDAGAGGDRAADQEGAFTLGH
jgi:hypothetical protein